MSQPEEALDIANIQQINAISIKTLIDAGFRADAVEIEESHVVFQVVIPKPRQYRGEESAGHREQVTGNRLSGTPTIVRFLCTLYPSPVPSTL